MQAQGAQAGEAGQANVAAGHAALGSLELARIFTVARHLKALALQADALPAVQCRADCWWIVERAAAHRAALARQLQQPVPPDRELALDHFEIVRSAALMEEIGAALATAAARDPSAPADRPHHAAA
jgi:hypothetical protein